MIHLDTNYLIGLVTVPSPVHGQIVAWLKAGETFSSSAIAWSEFLNGPVTPNQRREASERIERRVVPFDAVTAEMAAQLYNLSGRKRGSQVDCFIAAAAICARVPLATRNRKDFAPFVSAGLRLV
jgi:predicted nucleic acid-binding protein